MLTVKQLSQLAQVSVRTLHYYDEIALLRPSSVGSNGYRYYDDDAILRLQQILFYREVGLELLQIKDILDKPDFDIVSALKTHRQAMQDKNDRLHQLIETIDQTIAHVTGETTMSKKDLFKGFSEEQQKEYEREARLQYGPDNVNESMKRWNSYSKDQQQAIQEEGGRIYSDLADALTAGKSPNDPDVQIMIARWHESIRYFYEPTLEIMRGLGDLYNTDERFMATFHQFHAELPAYLQSAIGYYVDDLETKAIEALLAEDEAKGKQDSV